MEHLISPTEAAKLLKKPRQTITRWCREGKLIAYRVGKNWVIDRSDVERMKGKEND